MPGPPAHVYSGNAIWARYQWFTGVPGAFDRARSPYRASPPPLPPADLDAFADGLSGLRGASAAHREGAAVAVANFDGADDVLARFRNYDAERFDLIDAGVGRVEGARNFVETDFPLDYGFEFAA